MQIHELETIDHLEKPSFEWCEVLRSAIEEVGVDNFCPVDTTEFVLNERSYKTFGWTIIKSGNGPFPGEIEERELIDAFRYLLVMQEVIPLRAIGEDWKGDLTISFGFVQD